MDARAEWQDRYLKFHTFLSELEQFEVLDSIHNQEDKAGFYEVDSALATSEDAAAQSTISNLNSSVVWLDGLLDYINQNQDNQNFNQSVLAWLSHLSAYSSDANADNAAIVEGVSKPVLEHCQDYAEKVADYALSNEMRRAASELAIRQADLGGLQEKLKGLRKKSQWESSNVHFRRARTEALRRIFHAKREIMSKSGSGLDFAGQLDSALARCQRDFSDGLTHASAAELGLRTIFGYEETFPAIAVSTIAGEPTAIPAKALDAAIAWTRNADSWLTRFSQTDGQNTLLVALRRHVSIEAWNGFLQSGELKFELPEDFFPGQSHVRLRGISLHSRGINGILGASITTPRESFYRMSDGNTNSADQSEVPLLRVGAVRSYESARVPEVAGTVKAFNVSPIGEWSVSLSDLSTHSESLKRLDDLFIELTFAAIG